MYEKLTAHIVLANERMLSPKIRYKARIPTFILPFNIVLEVLVMKEK
jgi:hypothetical protein